MQPSGWRSSNVSRPWRVASYRSRHDDEMESHGAFIRVQEMVLTKCNKGMPRKPNKKARLRLSYIQSVQRSGFVSHELGWYL